jgi:uncharacterized protein (DUF58 family)
MEARLDSLADSILHGDRLSGFPGRGLEASGVREYQAGDEARGIDWRVTARKGRLHVRVFDEERDLPAIVVLHRSLDLLGGRDGIREIRALEVGGLISALSLKSGDRAGLLQGGSGPRSFLPPGRTRGRLPLILAALLDPPSDLRTDPLVRLLEKTLRLAKERSRVFLIGGFQLLQEEEGEVKRLLARLGVRHALHPVRVLDRREGVFPGGHALPLRDPRTGSLLLWRRGEEGELRAALDRDEDSIARLFAEVGLKEWRVDVGDSLVTTLQGCMTRERRRSTAGV